MTKQEWIDWQVSMASRPYSMAELTPVQVLETAKELMDMVREAGILIRTLP